MQSIRVLQLQQTGLTTVCSRSVNIKYENIVGAVVMASSDHIFLPGKERVRSKRFDLHYRQLYKMAFACKDL